MLYSYETQSDGSQLFSQNIPKEAFGIDQLLIASIIHAVGSKDPTWLEATEN